MNKYDKYKYNIDPNTYNLMFFYGYSNSFGVSVSSHALGFTFFSEFHCDFPASFLVLVELVPVQFAQISHLAQGWVSGVLALQLDTLDPSWPGARTVTLTPRFTKLTS